MGNKVVMMTNIKQGMHVKGVVSGLMYARGSIVAQILVVVMLGEEHANGGCQGAMMEWGPYSGSLTSQRG
jgi:hypothetical protein